MHSTVWTLLLALLLQLVAVSAWAMRASHDGHLLQNPHPAMHCHDAMAEAAASADLHDSTPASQTPHAQTDSHHCCATGLGIQSLHTVLMPLPQATPASPQGTWPSLNLPPDLRPPI